MRLKKNKIIFTVTVVAAVAAATVVLFIILMVTTTSPQRREIVAAPVQTLIEKLWDPNAQEICRTIITLKRLKNYRALTPLTLMLAHADERIRKTAARALLDLQCLDSVAELLKALKKTRLKANAALLLGRTSDYRAIRGLTPLLEDQNKEVQAAARSALDQLNSFKTVGHQELPGFPRDHKLVIANDSSITIYRYREKENKFEVEASTPIQSTRYLMVDPGNMVDPGKKQIIAVTLDKVVIFDTRLKVLMDKELPDPGAAAVYRDYLLVSDSGYLKALHLRRNLEEIDQIPLIRHTFPLDTQRKNAHDIIIYQDTAYLLDNIVWPVYVLKMNLGDLDRGKLEETKNIGLDATPANSYPHLDGQWLDPEENRWVLIISGSMFLSMGGEGGPCQGLYFLHVFGKEKNLHHVKYPQIKIDFYSIGRDREGYDYLLYSSPFDDSKELNQIKQLPVRPSTKGEGFWIWAVTSLAPPWALIEKNSKYYLVRMTVGRRKNQPHVYKKYEESDYRVFLYRYAYIGRVSEFPGGVTDFHIRNHGGFVFITIGERLFVVDAKRGVMPVLQQNFSQPIRDLLIH